MVYVTGDVHGYFGRIARFCAGMPGISRRDVLVILGDASINFWCDESDDELKARLAGLPVTLLCVHGNHEARPSSIEGYCEAAWRCGTVYVQRAYPNVLFAKDGSVFDLEGDRCLVAGGAYSVDKAFRVLDGRRWWPDEQPGECERRAVEDACAGEGWRVDCVFSHTAPLSLRPTEAFLASVNQAGVDTSTEEWLERIERRLDYRCWYCGHFHINKSVTPRFRVLHKDVVELKGGRVVYPR